MRPLRPTPFKPLASLPAPQGIPTWQCERAHRLHQEFSRVEIKRQGGMSPRRALRQFARYWRGRSYRSAPGVKCQFGLGTLCRLFKQWRRGGQVESALHLRYSGASVPAWVFQRFNEFVCRREFPNLRTAWDAYCARGCPAGTGRWPKRAKPPATYEQAVYWYGAKNFKEARRRLKAIAAAKEALLLAEVALAKFRLRTDAEMLRILPFRAERKRRTGAELSLNAAAL